MILRYGARVRANLTSDVPYLISKNNSITSLITLKGGGMILEIRALLPQLKPNYLQLSRHCITFTIFSMTIICLIINIALYSRLNWESSWLYWSFIGEKEARAWIQLSSIKVLSIPGQCSLKRGTCTITYSNIKKKTGFPHTQSKYMENSLKLVLSSLMSTSASSL